MKSFQSQIRCFLGASALAVCTIILPAQSQALAQGTDESAVDERYSWDLTPFYASEAVWEAELKRLREEIPNFGSYQGRLGRNAETLLEARDTQSAFAKDLLRVWTYASN
ncbi:MAG: hypothetical protein AAGC77_11530, partial [Pseudomonadota bacterium]